ncbi:MAG TPA: nitrilase-related carbon-nitrogen hydrolase [bacterium]|nr:nitrilase-related carbon-nitrogen hydrolase [bacterium]
MTAAHSPTDTRFLPAAGLFLLGFGLFMFCRRSDFLPMIPAMIIVAPIFILRFSRVLPTGRSMLLTALGFILAINIALWGIFDFSQSGMELAFNLIRSTLIGLLYALPYLFDRAVTPRLGDRFAGTLVFPAAATAVMFLASLEGPLDGTQAKNVFGTGPLPILQLYALAGLWGFVFLWSWVAALVNYAWERRFERRATMVAALVLVAAVGGVTAYGGLRLALRPAVPTVRVALAILPDEGGLQGMPGVHSMEQVYDGRLTKPYEATLAHIRADVTEAAAAGARLVTFQESAMIVTEADVARLKADLGRIAAENGVWLALPYAWFPPTGKGANMHLLVDDTGAVRIDYQKRYLLGFREFGEPAVFAYGAEVIQTTDSPFGRIAVAICKDMSFPPYARQAGHARADIMLTGSHEFPRGYRLNDAFRSVENGFTHVRTTYDGISYAMDPYGRVLARMANAEQQGGLVVADVPTQGAWTLYARLGDWLAWLSIAAVLGFAAWAIIAGRRNAP